MKTNFYVETANTKVLAQTLIDNVKEIWKNDGKRVKDMDTLDLYCKPDENACYYVINQKVNGKISM